jgi:hypothetical protein
LKGKIIQNNHPKLRILKQKPMKKTLLTFMMLSGLLFSTFAQEASKLGLAERRALKAYQETQYPAIEKGIKGAAGYDVPLEVKWEEIAKVGNADVYKENIYWGTTIFEPLTKALAAITADDMGKTALKAKLKKIIIMHDEKTAPASNFPMGLTWDTGTLIINWTPYSNTDATFVVERIKALQDLLESKL